MSSGGKLARSDSTDSTDSVTADTPLLTPSSPTSAPAPSYSTTTTTTGTPSNPASSSSSDQQRRRTASAALGSSPYSSSSFSSSAAAAPLNAEMASRGNFDTQSVSSVSSTDQLLLSPTQPQRSQQLLEDAQERRRQQSAAATQNSQPGAAAAPQPPRRAVAPQGNANSLNGNERTDAAGSPNAGANAAGDAAEGEEEDEDEELKYGAKEVMALIVPVTLCMAIVVASIQSITYYAQDSGDYLAYIAFKEDSDSGAENFGGAIINALIIVGVILVMTCVLVLLYKYRCYKAIWMWLFLSTVMLLFLFTYIYLELVFDRYNVAMDWVTFAFVIWNFGCVGVVAVHWKAPLLLQQAYLITTSALLALTLIKHLPEWTTWVLLAAIAVYDLFAVLCPRGPLKVLVETAQERNEPIFPALIYSSTMAWIAVAAVDKPVPSEDAEEVPQLQAARNDPEAAPVSTAQPTAPAAARQRRTGTNAGAAADEDEATNATAAAEQSQDSTAPAEDDEEHGVKLGLGDFIFYSVLVGKASVSNNWSTILSCFFAILVGLCLTLVLLAIYRRALPALPISIAFGLLFYYVSNEVLVPFNNQLSAVQVFV
ncbi:Presenilin2 [Capsaspora owczarzaki ATCC 30864]|uniref:Presenilin2 n=1 Tax=Capsaspora owczarzaki (strain ATCC 30864) TaxID=595528 RepID=UPI0003521CB1|nr:Presenilin2 [Capsaspora owczarzaki ATCC 30864]|eukprot:XP_004349389.2 Presenilin2 [Capsaspora owczarzaki ATCC 30864]